MWDQLPDEVIHVILSHLPGGSLEKYETHQNMQGTLACINDFGKGYDKVKDDRVWFEDWEEEKNPIETSPFFIDRMIESGIVFPSEPKPIIHNRNGHHRKVDADGEVFEHCWGNYQHEEIRLIPFFDSNRYEDLFFRDETRGDDLHFCRR
jgi:hypothetical protein